MGQLYVWYLNQLDDYNSMIDKMRELDSRRSDEGISISGVSVSIANVLTITVTNSGGVTSRIVSLWVIDESVTPNTHTRSSVDVYVSTGGTGTVTGTATYGNRLTLRLVTELGSIVSQRIAPASTVTNLRMTLVASPPTVLGKHDVGVTLYVFNNNTSYDSLYNLQIDPSTANTSSTDISNTYTGTGGSIILTPPTTTTISSLRSGETAVFTWTYQINLATPDQTFTFKGRYTGASAHATSTAQVVTPFGTTTDTDLASVFGSVRMVYGSMQWAIRSPISQTSGFTWNSNWQVDKDDYLVIRISITNDGTQSITLAQDTAIYIQRLETSGFAPFYIVKESGGTISTYDGSVVLQANSANTVTVYFAVDKAGDNPTSGGNSQRLGNAGTYIAFLGTFGTRGATPYAQTIPFQAFTATT